MKRVMLTVAYDGTAYSGFQAQDNAHTIEGELNRCLKELLKEEIRVIGGSRTDAGVHARCNVAVFDTQARMPAEKISYALNQRLPEDIRIQRSEEVAADFHPRHCESRKTYEYRIMNAEFPVPTKRLYSYFTYVPLDAERMKEAAGYLVGEHDFKSFCSAGSQAESTVRTIYDIQVLSEGEEIVIRVTGNGFLYNMVRIIAGTLIEAGKGRRKPEEMEAILAAKDRGAAGPTAPACGLMLMKYEFKKYEF
ncbi:MAG TPA: tRNA pseudouridine(38-40) synthase TruA [Lachnospiraceae bacterium]|nr:tRNA pseudouridine(38-40) synthase TruA [Lachnospiraceae bacterium]